MTFFLPGRFSGTLLISGVVGMGLLASSEAVICLMAIPRELRRTDDRASRTVRDVCWSANSRVLVVRSLGNECPCDSVTMYEVAETTLPIFTCCDSAGTSILDAAPSSDGGHLLLTTGAGEIKWIDVQTMETVDFTFPPKLVIDTAVVSHDSRMAAGATINDEIWLFCLATGKRTLLDSQQASTVAQLSFSDDDGRLLVSRRDGSIEVWDVNAGTLLRKVTGRARPAVAKFLPGGTRVIASTCDEHVQIWDVATGEVRWRQLQGIQCQTGIRALDVSADGSLAAWGGLDRRLVIWDSKHCQKRFEIENPSIVLHISFSADGKLLAVGGFEKLVRIYDTETGRELRQVDSTPQFES